MKKTAIASFCLFLFSASALAEEPALPPGLGGSVKPQTEPSLPSGLQSNEPSLPAGLLSDHTEQTSIGKQKKTSWRDKLPFELTGFAETRIGRRLQDDPTQKTTSLGEMRLHTSMVKSWEQATATLSADFLYDPIRNDHTPNLESGRGWFDLREANIVFRPTDYSDVKVGRQVLTWGTGDLIFINDLFPKDWNSFFIGRDEEYLKAPSDALKTSLYSDIANLDIAYTPRFDADRYIDGKRLSYYTGSAIAGRNQPINTVSRDSWFTEDEIALRLHRLVQDYETALYYYQGYWKSPEGQNTSGQYTFPALSVYGGSIRGPLWGGIANTEIGYYDSRDDKNGTNSRIRNSEWRFLAGYEHEIIPELTGAIQYYVEHMQDYSAYLTALPTGSFAKDRNRHVITTRLTQLLMNQTLTLSLFNFYSPSDEDGYARPKATYKLDDNWTTEIGGNIFYGRDYQTFFDQFEDNSNVYISMRYGF